MQAMFSEPWKTWGKGGWTKAVFDYDYDDDDDDDAADDDDDDDNTLLPWYAGDFRISKIRASSRDTNTQLISPLLQQVGLHGKRHSDISPTWHVW